MGPPVLIGGTPTISLQVLAGKLLFKGLGKIGKMVRKAQRGKGARGRAMRALTRRANAAGDALAKALKLGDKARNRIQRSICTITGHPVDVATGKVFTDHVDLTLPGPIPFALERVWYSTSTYRGPLGHGWHNSYDAVLYAHDDVVLYRERGARAHGESNTRWARRSCCAMKRICLGIFNVAATSICSWATWNSRNEP